LPFASIYHMSSRNVLYMLMLTGALAACSAKNPGATATDTGTPSAVGRAAGGPEVGQRIYSGNCVPCHQESGVGIPGVYPSLAGSPVVLGDPAQLTLWVLKGQRPASMPAGRYSTQMLQFGWMKPADAAALFSYVRSSFGNSAPPIDAATVERALGP
jgi:mono/diheme cytochrome c family protein